MKVLIYATRNFVGTWGSIRTLYNEGQYYMLAIEGVLSSEEVFIFFSGFAEVIYMIPGIKNTTAIMWEQNIESIEIISSSLDRATPKDKPRDALRGVVGSCYVKISTEEGVSSKKFYGQIVIYSLDHDTLEGRFSVQTLFSSHGNYSGNLLILMKELESLLNKWGEKVSGWTLDAAIEEAARLTNGTSFLVKRKTDGGVIETSVFQSWKVVALLKGLSFSHERSEDGDDFFSHIPIQEMYSGWEPSGDGSRLESFEDLSDESSVHYGRRYVCIFSFTTPQGYENVIGWETSAHNSSTMYKPIALSSFRDWRNATKNGIYNGLNHWLESYEVRL